MEKSQRDSWRKSGDKTGSRGHGGMLSVLLLLDCSVSFVYSNKPLAHPWYDAQWVEIFLINYQLRK